LSDYCTFLQRSFPPGAVYVFVGAGGKSTAMLKVAELCAGQGIRVRITATTRMARDEVSRYPLILVSDAAGFLDAVDSDEQVCVIAAAADGAPSKLIGVHPLFIDAVRPRSDLVILVEADGARRKPLKVPTERDPVIPRGTSTVFGLMGASGFAEAITEEHCYNHEAALRLLGRTGGSFEARSLAFLAVHPEGLRKGVLPGMAFHVIINQADIGEKRGIARETLSAIRAAGAAATLLSWQEERIYESL
jgi:probable selenium-dependent hydroxylase accessory protein YqeC